MPGCIRSSSHQSSSLVCVLRSMPITTDVLVSLKGGCVKTLLEEVLEGEESEDSCAYHAHVGADLLTLRRGHFRNLVALLMI